jgi:hypothetical protein
MNIAKCDDLDYINFLLASVDVFNCTEAARCYIDEDNRPSHDAFTRLLRRQPPDTKGLWIEVKDNIQPRKGFLIIDDTVLDKPYAKSMGLVYHHWSGKHHRVVSGIDIITTLWINGNAMIPVDFRISQSQRAHILFSLRGFVRLEIERLFSGISWFEYKWQIIRDSIKAFIEFPNYSFVGGAIT